MSVEFAIVPYDKAAHGAARKTFCCGKEPLDTYFREHMGRDVKNKVTNCFVALKHDHLVGYFTLSGGSVLLDELPLELGAKLPKYPQVPVTRLGRLAVDQKAQGEGLGAVMVANAMLRAATADIAFYALVVDAMDEEAKNFYLHLGFEAFSNSPMVLFHRF